MATGLPKLWAGRDDVASLCVTLKHTNDTVR